jgi:hypothetical protein
MSKRIQLAVLATAGLLAAGAAAAEEPWKYVGGEAVWTLAAPAPQASTAWPGLRAAQSESTATLSGWRFVGGEAGWIMAQHEYEFRGGALVHAHQAWCVASHDLPSPARSPLGDLDPQWILYRGA